jgi:hypothetical protein
VRERPGTSYQIEIHFAILVIYIFYFPKWKKNFVKMFSKENYI